MASSYYHVPGDSPSVEAWDATRPEMHLLSHKHWDFLGSMPLDEILQDVDGWYGKTDTLEQISKTNVFHEFAVEFYRFLRATRRELPDLEDVFSVPALRDMWLGPSAYALLQMILLYVHWLSSEPGAETVENAYHFLLYHELDEPRCAYIYYTVLRKTGFSMPSLAYNWTWAMGDESILKLSQLVEMMSQMKTVAGGKMIPVLRPVMEAAPGNYLRWSVAMRQFMDVLGMHDMSDAAWRALARVTRTVAEMEDVSHALHGVLRGHGRDYKELFAALSPAGDDAAYEKWVDAYFDSASPGYDPRTVPEFLSAVKRIRIPAAGMDALVRLLVHRTDAEALRNTLQRIDSRHIASAYASVFAELVAWGR